MSSIRAVWVEIASNDPVVAICQQNAKLRILTSFPTNNQRRAAALLMLVCMVAFNVQPLRWVEQRPSFSCAWTNPQRLFVLSSNHMEKICSACCAFLWITIVLCKMVGLTHDQSFLTWIELCAFIFRIINVAQKYILFYLLKSWRCLLSTWNIHCVKILVSDSWLWKDSFR